MSTTSLFQNAKNACRDMVLLNPKTINLVLEELAKQLVANTDYILAENQKDLAKMDPENPKYDRLLLNPERIVAIAAEVKNVAGLASPLGNILQEKTLPNQLNLKKVRVPLGVVGVIYEARPNVTVDVFSLCFKTGNVALLKGGSDADFSNNALCKIIHQVLLASRINTAVLSLLPPDRDSTDALLKADKFVDVIIPRGSQSLIDFVRANSKVPVIETGAGIVHTFFDSSADLEKGKKIILNAKTRRVSVCNSLDCVLVHQNRLNDLAQLLQPLAEKRVEIFADESAFEVLDGNYPKELLQTAQAEHFGTEFLSLKLAVKTVENLNEALNHIASYSSKHSEAILSEDAENIALFLNQVDAAAVYVNTSTAFTDGAQFGLGAEIGISTQKLHARGPMALDELTSYKWLVTGDGQIRS
jgi:glutamate-5-semialdehyde dehydrogenase